MPEKRTMSCLGSRILTFFVASMGVRHENPSACLQCAHLQVVLQVATRITFCPVACPLFFFFFFSLLLFCLPVITGNCHMQEILSAYSE